jgi:proline dehydrogenase
MGVISFDNTGNAFAYKSDKQLKKASLLFSTMHYPWLVKLGTTVMPWAIKTGLPIGSLIRHTIFEQFVGGETLEETAPVASRLGDHQVKVILDYGVEGGHDGEPGFDHSRDEFLRVIHYAASQPNIPFISIKVTGMARFGLLEKLDRSVEAGAGSLMKRFQQALESLTPEERAEWDRVENRLETICSVAVQKNIGVLIDAEETWIQDPVDVLAIQMMDRFNKSKAIVYNTAQLYRHDRLEFVKDSIEAAQLRGFVLGIKLVRGAYMEKERERALMRNYASPIQPDKASSDRDYNEALRICLEHINQTAIIVATHNEESSLLAAHLLAEMNLPLDHPHVHFSQLYGMSDHITFNLAKAGYSVSKYLPFGPIKDVIPYLMRRAQENSSVAGQTNRELALIQKELARRQNT